MNARLWTNEEIARALALWGNGYGCGEIAQMLTRTECSVRLKFLGMGLSTRRIPRNKITDEVELAEEAVSAEPELEGDLESDILRIRAEQELEKRERRVEDRRQIEEAKADILADRIAREFARHLREFPRVVNVTVPPVVSPSDSGSPCTAVLVLSDVHVGQVVDPREIDGIGNYNPAITLARLLHLQREATRVLADRNVERLLLLYGGDILHGHLGHSMEDDLTVPIALQADFALNIFFPFVAALCAVVPAIEIHGVAGNHGRWPGMRKMPTDRRWSNLDTIFYNSLSALCSHSGLKNVRFDARIASRRIIQAGRYTMELLHGDEVRGGAYCTGGMHKEVTNSTLRQVQAGRRHIDYYIMGDKHFPASIPFGSSSFVVNGSFVGVDGFGMNFLPSPPSQTLFFLHPEHGKTETHEIRLQGASLPSSLPFNLKPDLEALVSRYL